MKLVRFTINWRQVARKKPVRAGNPGDPAYDWSKTDAVLNGLRKHRIAVLATLYGTPAWANGGKAANVIPKSKSSFGAFALAAAKRYPWITMWEIWNEPNLRRFLSPNSPALYVQRLLNPAYAALHSVRRSNRVAGGATSPRPTPSGLSPVAFMRGMRAAHARLDAYSHHPYPVTPGETPSSFAHGSCRYCKGVLTLANLPLLLKEVRRDFGGKRIWLTEYGYQTNPPDRFGVSTARQSEYVSEAALRAKSARFVDVLIHFMVRDEPAALRLAERLPHPFRRAQAGVLRLHAPDRAGLAPRQPHDDLGPGASGPRPAGLQPPAARPRTLVERRRLQAHQLA